jgi:hypothetical protein
MGYRRKLDLYASPPGPEERKQRRFIFVLMPLIVLSTNGVSIVHFIVRLLGFSISLEMARYGVIILGVLCVAGGIWSYRSTRAEVRRDIEELTPDQKVQASRSRARGLPK